MAVEGATCGDGRGEERSTTATPTSARDVAAACATCWDGDDSERWDGDDSEQQ